MTLFTIIQVITWVYIQQMKPVCAGNLNSVHFLCLEIIFPSLNITRAKLLYNQWFYMRPSYALYVLAHYVNKEIITYIMVCLLYVQSV